MRKPISPDYRIVFVVGTIIHKMLKCKRGHFGLRTPTSDVRIETKDSLSQNLAYALPPANQKAIIPYARLQKIKLTNIECRHFAFPMNMDLNQLVSLDRGPRLNLIQWLQNRSGLANLLRCAQCNMDMGQKERYDNHIDGFHW